MSKRLVNAILPEPEILSEFKIKWDGYEPSNGYAFQKFFYETGKSALLSAKDICQKRKDELAGAKVMLVDLRKQIEAFASLSLASESSLVTKVLGDEIVEKMKDNFPLADEMLRRVKDYAPDPQEMKCIDVDITLIDSIIGFFDNDIAMDMMLYSLRVVDKKYRTKIFRQCMKHLQAVEECMTKIDNSTSAIKEQLLAPVKEAYDNLKYIYTTLSFGMRRQKKALDKMGTSFWDKYKIDDSELKTAQKAVA